MIEKLYNTAIMAAERNDLVEVNRIISILSKVEGCEDLIERIYEINK